MQSRELTRDDEHEVLGRNCRFLQGPHTDKTEIPGIREDIAAAIPLAQQKPWFRPPGEASEVATA